MDEVMPLLEQLHALTRTRLTQGAIVSTNIRAGDSGYDRELIGDVHDLAVQQHSALDAFEVATEKVHGAGARVH